jgi:hypothetical protein
MLTVTATATFKLFGVSFANGYVAKCCWLHLPFSFVDSLVLEFQQYVRRKLATIDRQI